MDLRHGYLRQGTPTGRARRVRVVLGGLAVAVLCSAVAAAVLIAWPSSATRSSARPAFRTPAFVKHQLGARRAALPVVSSPRYRAASEVTSGGLRVRLGSASVALNSADGGNGRWTSYAGGAARRTAFGQEFVTVAGSGAEQLLQVDRHQGAHTWRWKLDTSAGLTPSLRDDGTVAFSGPGGKDTGVRITQVELLDRRGATITPENLRWSLASKGDTHFLELRLDDRLLPVPYVIDPAVTFVSFSSTSMEAGATADWTVNFTTGGSGSLAAGNTITVTFPNTVATHLNFVPPASPTIVLGAGFMNCSAAAVGAAPTVTITLANSGGACAVGNSTAATLTINGMQNPTRAASNINKSTFTVLTSKDAPAGNWGVGTVQFTTGLAVQLLLVLSGQTADPGSLTDGLTAATPSKLAANTSTNITLQAVDQYWNRVMTVTDTIALTSSDALATFAPTATPTLVAGQWLGAGTLKTPLLPGQTITATDTTDPLKTANTSDPVPVYAPNGSGTMTVDTANVSDGATETLSFTYTAATGGTMGGVARLQAPTNWPTPAAGNTTIAFSGSGSGALGFSAPNRINLSALTMSAGETLTITYGPVTVPAVGTAATWSSYEGSVGATFTALTAGSPTVTVNAPDGSGTMSVSPTLVTAGSTTNTHTFTYSAAAGGMSNGKVQVAVPAGWTAPNTTSGTPGYTVASTGTVATAGSNITVTGVTLAGGATMTITYGSGGGGPVTAPTAAGTSTFTTSQNSTASSPLVALGSSPSVTVDAGAASDFVLSGTPASLTAGSTGSVTVTAIDGYGNTATTFTGTVTFTSNDAQAVLPADYTFTGGDAGVHAFTNLYTLKTAGSRTVAATSGSVTGTSAGITVNSALPAATMTATAPSPTTAGTGLSVTVTAKDAYGNIATSYTGTVSLTSTDPQAALPGPYTFVGADNGSHAIPVTLKTVGSQTVSSSDGTLNATTGGVTVNPGPTSTLALSGTPGLLTAGNAGSVTVTAQDAYGNTTPAYTGTVIFTSSDAAWVAPANYTFTGGDAGVHTFTNAYTLKTAGSRTVTATDTPTSSITGTSGAITVNAAAASTALSTLVAAPGSITANGTSTSAVTVQLKDAFGNNLLGSGGTVALSTTQGSLSAVDRQRGRHLHRHAHLVDHGVDRFRHRHAERVRARRLGHGHVRSRPHHELRRERPRLGDGRHRHQRKRHGEGCVRQHHAGVHGDGQPDEHRPAGDGSRLARVHRRRRRRLLVPRDPQDRGLADGLGVRRLEHGRDRSNRGLAGGNLGPRRERSSDGDRGHAGERDGVGSGRLRQHGTRLSRHREPDEHRPAGSGAGLAHLRRR